MLAHLDILRQDLSYAFRQLRRNPGFTVVAILSLGIGIGANATSYSIAHALLNRQVRAVRPSELVRVYRGEHSGLMSDWYSEFSRNSRTLAAMIAEDLMPIGVDAGGESERAAGLVVSENYFTALGLRSELGTAFAGRPGEAVGALAVLSHRYWSTRFGGDRGVVGTTVRLNGIPFTVVGVAEEGFESTQFGWAADVFVPFSQRLALRGLPPDSRSQSSFYITGRLARGATPAQVATEMTTLAASIPNMPEPQLQPGGFRVEPARGISAEVRTPAAIVSAFLLFVVGVVLLIACANLANLLLARATTRRREVAIRQALGVSRGRLIRQLLTENLVVSVLGGAVGALLAFYVTRLLPALVPEQGRVELSFDVTPDANVFIVTALIALAAGAIFGLAPALQASRTDVSTLIKSDAAGSGSRRSKLRSAFLTGQVALATLLMVTAGLFLRGLGNAQHIDTGYRGERVVDQMLDLSLRNYDADRGRAYQRDVFERVGALSGVEAVAFTSVVPLTGSSSGTSVARGEADTADARAFRGSSFNVVSPGYFEMFAIPVAEGRPFNSSDRDGAPLVAVVNETLARRLWPDEPAVGRTMRLDGGDTYTVVGVARDVKYASLGSANESFFYLPHTQAYRRALTLQVRLAADTPGARTAVRQALQSLDPALPLPAMMSFDDDIGLALIPARFSAVLIAGFGALALFLAAIGVYGVTAYLVGQRTAEIGIRTALGATGSDVLRLVMRETLVLVAIGLGLGLAGGIGVGTVASSALYGVGALDPVALSGACAVLAGVALLGAWLPAKRALRIDPMRALRTE